MSKPNLFADARKWTGAGEENLFSVGLAHTLARHPEALQRFLSWIEEECGVTLPKAATWSIHLEQGFANNDGRCFVDMLLRAEGVELWCEHKISSPLSNSQAQHYLEAMAQRMSIKLPASPCMLRPAEGRPKVLLAVISRCRQDMSYLRPWRVSDSSSAGVLWAATKDRGYLRWQDLRPQLEHLEFDALGAEFVEWFSTLPLMASPEPARTWQDLIPVLTDAREYSQTLLAELWYASEALAKAWGWTLNGSRYAGNNHEYRRQDSAMSLEIKAVRQHDEIVAVARGKVVGLEQMRAELLEVTLARSGVAVEPDSGELDGSRWSLLTTGDRVRAFVEVRGWTEAADQSEEARAAALAEAFAIGIQVLENRTGCPLRTPEP